jgi:MFS family permease
MLPAAFASVAKDYGVSDKKASYLTTCNSLFGGITPLFFTPFVNMYGRRPAYVV